MEPAASVIKALGGHSVVAEYLHIAKNTPFRWTYPRDRGGTGGIIPHWHHEKLLQMAVDCKISLSRTELIEGVAAFEAEAAP